MRTANWLAGVAGLATLATMHSAAALDTPAAPALTGPEASIPFVNHRGIRSFHTVDDNGIYLEASSRQWYYAQFFAPCIGINFVTGLRFRGNAVDSLDRDSSIYTRSTGDCKIISLRPSEPPASGSRKSKAKPANPAAPATPAAPT